MWDFFFFWRPPFFLRSVHINLKSGEALSGVLWQSRGRWMVLRNAKLMVEGNPQATPLDGEVFVDRDNVTFLQAL